MSDELAKMMVHISIFLEYTIERIINERPDIILLYYPSKYDFYWFVARIVHLLKRNKDKVYPLPEIYERLSAVMKGAGKYNILKQAKKKGNTNYWVEFIGNYARKERDDDALFSTALALNALIDTFTVRDGQKIEYDEDTPEEVKKTIEAGIKYLLQNHNNKNSEMNAFFSGSVKGDATNIAFPANVHQIKGKSFDPQTFTVKNMEDLIELEYSVKGYIEKGRYDGNCGLMQNF